MDLYTDSDSPTLDPGVAGRLNRLDPHLQVTFSQWAIDPFTSRPLLTDHGNLVKNPLFHLWSRPGTDGRWYYVKAFPRFGHRAVLGLELDAARTMRPTDIVATHLRIKAERQERALGDYKGLRTDIGTANMRRIQDLMFNGKGTTRDAKIISYPGQTHLSTPGRVEKSDREDGWELPERDRP